MRKGFQEQRRGKAGGRRRSRSQLAACTMHACRQAVRGNQCPSDASRGCARVVARRKQRTSNFQAVLACTSTQAAALIAAAVRAPAQNIASKHGSPPPLRPSARWH